MAKLTRYLQKIFANDSNRVGVFGTGVNKETSKNVETLQSADYENGWSAAIVTNKNYPIWQERDGVDYGLSYQIKYLDQNGLPEWIATETYYTTSYCQHNGGIYRSKVNDNIGNIPVANTSNEYWQYLGRNFLNTQQVTNCFLEVPQRVKYTLVDGVLTILAGSVIIVPYGTTDLSSTYPVGATFINDNLKVYDTYWDSTNSKFYVWAELQADVVEQDTTGADIVRTFSLAFNLSSIKTTNSANDISVSSDASAPNYCIFYNTSTNLVKTKSSGSVLDYTVSFPLIKTVTNATYNVSAIKQVFNGMGYIGAVVWADRGIKYLRPNGKNADGTLNNIEVTTDKLMLLDLGTLADMYGALVFDENGVLGHTLGDYNPETNSWFSPNYSNVHWCGIGSFTLSSGVITGATFDSALNINSMCDGRWVNSNLTIATSVNSPTSTNIEYSLSTYLPNDGYTYEVIFSMQGGTASSANSYQYGFLQTDILRTGTVRMYVARVAQGSSNSVKGAGTATLPVGAGRKVIVLAEGTNTGTFNLYAEGYRRVGTNS